MRHVAARNAAVHQAEEGEEINEVVLAQLIALIAMGVTVSGDAWARLDLS